MIKFENHWKSCFLLGIACLQPVANYAAINITDQAFVPSRSVLHFFILFFIACLSFIFVSIIFRPKNTFFVAFAIAVTILFFFNYFIYHGLLRDIVNLIEGILDIPYLRLRYEVFLHLLILFCILYFFRKVATSVNLTSSSPLSTILIFSLATVPAIDLAVTFPRFISDLVDVKLVEFELPPPDKGDKREFPSTRPNVYLLIPDGLPSTQNIVQILGEHDYKIPGDLEDRGFRVIKNSSSNGLVTYSSLPHFFTMDYFLEHNKPLTNIYAMQSVVEGKNPVIRGFHSRGYKYYRVEGFNHMPGCSGVEDVCLGNYPIDRNDIKFISRTYFGNYSEIYLRLIRLFLEKYKNLEIPDVIENLPAKAEGPFFFHAHVAIPHTPYRYYSDCTMYEEELPLDHPRDWQKHLQIDHGQDLKKWKVSLKNQITCAESQIVEFVDAVIKQDPHAIIIIQSDHGITYLKDQPKFNSLELTSEGLTQLAGNFEAFYMPDICASHLRPRLSPVNTFRLVFACLDGQTPKLIEDRTFVLGEVAIELDTYQSEGRLMKVLRR